MRRAVVTFVNGRRRETVLTICFVRENVTRYPQNLLAVNDPQILCLSCVFNAMRDN